MSDNVDVTIIGAGVVGLAIAAELAAEDRTVYVLEKNETFGLEISARHSGVIHSGIYYPKDSLKASLCVRGNKMLYELCEKYQIGCKKLGKLIVATCDEEIGQVEILFTRGQGNGADGLRVLSQREVQRYEPNVVGMAALLSESTGIIDSYALMKSFIARIIEGGGQLVYQTEVVGIDKVTNGYQVTIADRTGTTSFNTSVLINCAGLFSDKVAAMAGIEIEKAGYKLYYCKGEYFSVGNGKNKLVQRLVYPVPPVEVTGVGIHVTLDMEGRMRLGPSIEYVDTIDYAIDSRNQGMFCESVRRFLPAIEYDDLAPEMVGIRPKLQKPGGKIKDYVIRDESDKGLPGFINLVGIESPGLTASPAIASYVAGLLANYM